MSAINKINLAQVILEKILKYSITSIEINYENPRILINLKNSSRIYIQYNNHEQYSYSVLFSDEKLDRCRFDNFDAHWDVTTKPHHFHPRLAKTPINSPMKGDPNKDMEILCKLIDSGKLFLKNPDFSVI